MIQLTMSDETARVVSDACEFYMRMRIGQYDELTWRMMEGRPTAEWCERRERAKLYLLMARAEILPELHGWGHSYGMGKFEDADRAFDVHQVLRNQFGDNRTPFTNLGELPMCKRLED